MCRWDGLFVDVKAHLGAFEVHGTCCKASLSQNLRQPVQRDELVGEVCRGPQAMGLVALKFGTGLRCVVARQLVVLFAGLAALFQERLHLLVGEAAVALDNGVCQVPFLHLRLLVDLEDDAVAQLLLVGAQ